MRMNLFLFRIKIITKNKEDNLLNNLIIKKLLNCRELMIKSMIREKQSWWVSFLILGFLGYNPIFQIHNLFWMISTKWLQVLKILMINFFYKPKANFIINKNKYQFNQILFIKLMTNICQVFNKIIFHLHLNRDQLRQLMKEINLVISCTLPTM